MVKELGRDKVLAAAQSGQMLTLTTHGYFSDEREQIDEILSLFLQEAGKPSLLDCLSYCIHELASNAKKANTKRVYFEERGLAIDDEPQYWIGMRDFRKDTVERIDHYLRRLQEAGLHVKIQFKLTPDELFVAVRNNIRLSEIERGKIEQKIARGRHYKDMADAYANIEDTSEGAGLGIAMMIIMLRGLGLGEKVLRFFSNEKETFVTLTIPLGITSSPEES
jgi:hypothetical protein